MSADSAKATGNNESRRRTRWHKHVDAERWDEHKSWPYRWLRRPAYGIKALLQMAIGVHAVLASRDHLFGGPESTVLEPIAHALAAAAVVELAYTLFTPGPDEVLDPLMLGLTSVLLLRLAGVDELIWTEALATLLFVLCLAILFGVKKYLGSQRHGDAKSAPGGPINTAPPDGAAERPPAPQQEVIRSDDKTPGV